VQALGPSAFCQAAGTGCCGPNVCVPPCGTSGFQSPVRGGRLPKGQIIRHYVGGRQRSGFRKKPRSKAVEWNMSRLSLCTPASARIASVSTRTTTKYSALGPRCERLHHHVRPSKSLQLGHGRPSYIPARCDVGRATRDVLRDLGHGRPSYIPATCNVPRAT
jgi:hypothetical protein